MFVSVGTAAGNNMVTELLTRKTTRDADPLQDFVCQHGADLRETTSDDDGL